LALRPELSAIVVEKTTDSHLPGELVATFPALAAGFAFAENWRPGVVASEPSSVPLDVESNNPLKNYFTSHKTGRGIWKWNHYFDIYHRYFKKFIGRQVGILEIGIYSGGSLDMWRTYFGSGCQVYGVDIQEACKVYEAEGVKIFIGDQADRLFWQNLRKEVPQLDIVIDDGGHTPDQQIVTLEEMLPYLRPGGIYLCEDVHRVNNRFTAYVGGLLNHFNSTILTRADDLTAIPTEFQRAVYSIHSYPFIFVIERSEGSAHRFVAPKHGTEWQPFYDVKPPAAPLPASVTKA
jgi:23S rRNA U2552 (ribose-2'-O)-methylase RlmE/FtsJ